MTDKFSRRDFLKRAGIIGVTTCGLGLAGDGLLNLVEESEAASRPTLGIGMSGNAETLVKKALSGLGGMSKFVKRGSTVVIKPNLAWTRTPEQAANTNPEVITAIVKLCKQAGAKRITVIDHSCESSSATFEMSGAKKACAAAGVRLISADKEFMYKKVSIPKGKILKSDQCVKEILDADVFINVPIAKVHGASTVTASMKNLMGTNFDRQAWHRKGLDQCIADYSTVVKPDLIILDCTRILMSNGPKGPGEVKKLSRVAAGVDPVMIDAYAATLLGKDPKAVKHIALASSMGLGQIDLNKVAVKKV